MVTQQHGHRRATGSGVKPQRPRQSTRNDCHPTTRPRNSISTGGTGDAHTARARSAPPGAPSRRAALASGGLLACTGCFPAPAAFLHQLLSCTSCFLAPAAFLHQLLSYGFTIPAATNQCSGATVTRQLRTYLWYLAHVSPVELHLPALRQGRGRAAVDRIKGLGSSLEAHLPASAAGGHGGLVLPRALRAQVSRSAASARGQRSRRGEWGQRCAAGGVDLQCRLFSADGSLFNGAL